ncbi:MAG TPA: HNH endonuclease [Blastocatellia bacterium]|nr:HNH endonuclease [Blastocatellia bacterium]
MMKLQPFTKSIATLAVSITFLLLSVALAQQGNHDLPNPNLTPGATLKLTKDDLCGPNRKEVEGNIPISLKTKVFELYKIRTEATEPHNIDHLIPVSLGGSNDIANLWPQPLSGEWNYNKKNELERRLRRMVCGGELELATAQREISTDWVSAYKKYIGEPRRQKMKQPQ